MVRLAWADARYGLSKVAIAYLALVLGVAALVCVLGVRADFFSSLNANTRELLGADIEFSVKRPFSTEFLGAVQPYVAQQAEELRLRTMGVDPKSGDARLVQLHAIGGEFPFFGSITTEPADRWTVVQQSAEPQAIVEQTLLDQLSLRIGEMLRIGGRDFTIIGVVTDAPGMVMPAYVISPRVYIKQGFLEGLNLTGRGALVDYQLYGVLAPGVTSEKISADLQSVLARERIDVRSHQKRAEVFGASYANVGLFLSLSAFVALLIGAAAAVAATHVYLQRKLSLVAVLNCLGASKRSALAVCLYEITGLAGIASSIGIVLGLAFQIGAVSLLNRFAPVSLEFDWHPLTLVSGFGVGVGTVILYSLPLLLALRKVTPLEVLRAQGLDHSILKRNRWLEVGVLGTVIGLFAITTAQSVRFAVMTCLIAVIGLSILVCMAWLLMRLVRMLPEERLPFTVRHGVKNLARPGNATMPLTCAVGMVSLFANTVLVTGHYLGKQAALIQNETTPNVFLYDVQVDQREGLGALIQQTGARLLQETPVVMMRIDSIKGRSVGELLGDPGTTIPDWALTREYWSSYRENPVENETIVAGAWTAQVNSSTQPVPISIEDRMAERLGVTLGDPITFDVQGTLVQATVGSLRRIHWERIERNAIIVFPAGVLESFPQFRFLSLHLADPVQFIDLQRTVTATYPNISMVDLRLVIQGIEKILAHIAWAFLLVTGVITVSALLALAGIAVAGREVRQRELLLFRILGARSDSLRKILFAESVFLGGLGLSIGVLLAIGAALYLSFRIFHTDFSLPGKELVVVNTLLWVMVVLASISAHRSLAKRSALRLLQAE